jgi:hypothetical protein
LVEIVIFAVLLLICCVLALLLIVQRHAKANESANAWRAGHEQGLALGKAASAQLVQRVRAYEQLLSGHQGGVGRHLADTRELADLIRRLAPGLLKESSGLAQQLQGNDDFLSQLLDAYVAAELDANGAQSRAAARWPAGIYADIFEAAGQPAPGAVKGKYVVISLEAGIVVIRGTALHGCVGKIKLARRDLERFFNDLSAPPRSLADDVAGGLVCRGLYRVDVKESPQQGQLVIEVNSPSSGRLHLGDPPTELDALQELRMLKRPVQKLLEDEANSPARKAAAARARILRRDALLGHVPEDGLCPACEGDVTMRLRLGDKPTCCPLCSTPWSD